MGPDKPSTQENDPKYEKKSTTTSAYAAKINDNN